MQNQNRVEIGEEPLGFLHSVGMGERERERELSDEVKGKHMDIAANWMCTSKWGDWVDIHHHLKVDVAVMHWILPV